MTGKRITLMCRWDWASVANRLAIALNRHTSWKARCVTMGKHRFEIYRDVVYDGSNGDEIQELLNNSDVVMYGSSFADWTPPGVFEPRDIVRTLWHGGSDYRNNPEFYNKAVHPLYDGVFAHRDLCKLHRIVFRLDQPFDVQGTERTIHDIDDRAVIAHSPSDRRKKGTYYFNRAREILDDDKIYADVDIEWLLLENMSPKEVLEAKRGVHIFFDQIGLMDENHFPPNARAYYGLSLIESAARGSVCMSWSDFMDMPSITVTNEDDIQAAIKTVLEETGMFKELSDAHRRWAMNVHDYKPISKKFIHDLDKVCELAEGRKPGEIRRGSNG
jgi:hypothetical protein